MSSRDCGELRANSGNLLSRFLPKEETYTLKIDLVPRWTHVFLDQHPWTRISACSCFLRVKKKDNRKSESICTKKTDLRACAVSTSGQRFTDLKTAETRASRFSMLKKRNVESEFKTVYEWRANGGREATGRPWDLPYRSCSVVLGLTGCVLGNSSLFSYGISVVHAVGISSKASQSCL